MSRSLEVRVGHRPKSPFRKRGPLLLDVVLFLSCQPSSEEREITNNAIANLYEGAAWTGRLTTVSFDDDGYDNYVEIIGEFEERVLNKLSKRSKLSADAWKKPPCHKFCFVVDEVTSYLIMEMMGHYQSQLHKETVGLVFMRHSNRIRGQQLQDGARKIPDIQRLAKITETFTEVALEKNSFIRPVTWIVDLDEPVHHGGSYEKSIEAAIAIIKVANSLAVAESRKQTTWGNTASMLQLRKASTGGEPQKIRHGTVTLYPNYRQPRNSVTTGAKVPNDIDSPDCFPESQPGGPDRVNTGYKSVPLPRYGFSRGTLDPLVHMHIRDIQPGLHDVDEYLRAGHDPGSLHAVEVRTSRAALKIIAGQVTMGRQDLERELSIITAMRENRNPKETAEIRAVARYWFAEALFRLGEYKEAFDQLEEDAKAAFSSSTDKVTEIKLPIQVPAGLQLIHIFQLRALSVANTGKFKTANSELDKAQRLLRHLSRSLSARSLNEEPIDHQVAYVSLNITKSRIIALRGDYRQALGVMLGTFNHSIILIGETHLWTLHASVFTSQLMVLTSRFDQARVLIEKSLRIIQEHTELSHPLAIGALSVLTSVAQAEGRVLQGLSTVARMSLALGIAADPETTCPTTVMLSLQAGFLELQSGNFKTAESILDSAKKSATHKWTAEHPLALKAQAQLALAQYHLGKLATARDNILRALKVQLELFQGVPPNFLLWTSESGAKACFEKLIRTRDIYYYRRSMVTLNDPVRIEDDIIHPEALSSFLILGKIESASRSHEGVRYASVLFHLVFSSSQQQLGDSKDMTMEAAIGLGRVEISSLTYAANPVERTRHYNCANSHFQFVTNQAFDNLRCRDKPAYRINVLPYDNAKFPAFSTDLSASMCHAHCSTKRDTSPPIDNDKRTNLEREQLMSEFEKNNTCSLKKIGHPAFSLDLSVTSFGNEHPTVLRARQEFIMVNLFFNSQAEVDTKEIEATKTSLLGVLRAQEHRLGWDHPDRLHTLAALLPVQLAGNDSEQMLESTFNDLLRRLRKPEIRPQRISETLLMTENAAKMFLTRKGLFADRIEKILKTLE